MVTTINYEAPDTVSSDIALPGTLTNSEVELFRCTDQKYLHKSQLTVLASVVLSGLTTATFNVYFSPNATTLTWYPLSLYNNSTGVLTQESFLLNSTSYSDGSSWYGTVNVPIPAHYAFKITGKVNTGTPAYTLNVIARDN